MEDFPNNLINQIGMLEIIMFSGTYACIENICCWENHKHSWLSQEILLKLFRASLMQNSEITCKLM